MSAVLAGLVLFLAATVIAALGRVFAGPTPADRLLAPQLFGTAGIAALLLAAEWLGAPALRDVALVLALLAFVTTTAFALRAWGTGEEPGP